MTRPGTYPSLTDTFGSSEPIPLDDPMLSGHEVVDVSAVNLLNSYAHIFLVAFLVVLLLTPFVRRLAVMLNVVDHPNDPRKIHKYPIAYLGGVAVFAGLFAAIFVSQFAVDVPLSYARVPLAVVLGMLAITLTGLGDDVWGWDPRVKIAGQLFAAAALAISDVGVHVAEGVLNPLLGPPDEPLVWLGSFAILNAHVSYWTGTAIIAIFVLGGCNAANFIDGLDGLLSGTVAIVAVGLLVICLMMAPAERGTYETINLEATTAAATYEQAVEDWKEDRGTLPQNIDQLVGTKFLEKKPAVPIGWELHYGAPSGQVISRDNRHAIAEAKHKEVQSQIRLFDAATGRAPRSINELVADGYLPERPVVPFGYSLRYNPNRAQVQLTSADESLTGAGIVLCLALFGAVLGFLPHNFNPASIFLGDCGSLLLGYLCVVVILMLGDRGQTHLVFAGLIVFAVPIMDTTLAIIRRVMAGQSPSVGDDQHIHHQLQRSLGGVKRAVFALYGINILFALLGVILAALVLQGIVRVRFIYVMAIVLFGFIGVIAVKGARRRKWKTSAH